MPIAVTPKNSGIFSIRKACMKRVLALIALLLAVVPAAATNVPIPYQFNVGGNGTVVIWSACSILFSNGAIMAQNNADLCWDNTNHWLKIPELYLIGSSSGDSTISAPATGGGNLTLPPGNGTLASIAATQTLTNKSISGSTNTLSNIGLSSFSTIGAGTLLGNNGGSSAAPSALSVSAIQTLFGLATTSTSGDVVEYSGTSGGQADSGVLLSSLATLSGTQTLTNKTLTSPTINSPAISGGTINNATLGATTPLAVHATTMSATGLVDLSASGAGNVKFPTTENPSANANTLDDYNSTTSCTAPVVTGSVSNPTVTYALQDCVVTKVGALVSVSEQLAFSVFSGGSGYAKISVPYTENSTAESFGSCYFDNVTFPAGTTIGVADLINGSATYRIKMSGTGVVASNLLLSEIGASSTINCTLTYTASQ